MWRPQTAGCHSSKTFLVNHFLINKLYFTDDANITTEKMMIEEAGNLLQALYLVTLNIKHYRLHNLYPSPPWCPYNQWDGFLWLVSSQQVQRWLTDSLPPDWLRLTLFCSLVLSYQMFWVEFGHQASGYSKGISETDGDVWYISQDIRQEDEC